MNAVTIVFGIVGAGALLLLVEIVKALLLTEAHTRLERLPLAILRLACRRLAARHRTTIYEDEWLPDLEFIARETGGLPITRLFRSTWFAIGLLWSARAVSAARGRPADSGTGPTLDGLDGVAVDPASFTRFQHDAVLAIRTILAHQPDLPVLSIEGPWGSGKTSVLAQVQHVDTDAADDSFITVAFNPWQHEHELAPTANLIDAIESAVAEARQQAEGQTRRPWRWRRSPAGLHRRSGRRLLRVFGAPTTNPRAAGRRRVVVLIDDLDRCCPDTVLAVLRTVRLLSRHAPDGLRFVLAFDPDCLAAFLDRALAVIDYPSGATSTAMSGRAFLEKVICVQARLPQCLRPLPPTPGIATPPFRATDHS